MSEKIGTPPVEYVRNLKIRYCTLGTPAIATQKLDKIGLDSIEELAKAENLPLAGTHQTESWVQKESEIGG